MEEGRAKIIQFEKVFQELLSHFEKSIFEISKNELLFKYLFKSLIGSLIML